MLSRSQIGYLKGRIAKQATAAREIVSRAGPTLAEFLEFSGSEKEQRTRILENLASKTNDMVAYRLYARYFLLPSLQFPKIHCMKPCQYRSGQYVDISGQRHNVTDSDVVGAATDPLGEIYRFNLGFLTKISFLRIGILCLTSPSPSGAH